MKIEVKTSSGEVLIFGDVASAVFVANMEQGLNGTCEIKVDGEEISYSRLLIMHEGQKSRKSTERW